MLDMLADRLHPCLKILQPPVSVPCQHYSCNFPAAEIVPSLLAMLCAS